MRGRGLDRAAGIGGVGVGDAGKGLLGGGVDDIETLVGGSGDPLAVDEEIRMDLVDRGSGAGFDGGHVGFPPGSANSSARWTLRVEASAASTDER